MSEEKPLHVRVAEALGETVEFRVPAWDYRKDAPPTWMRKLRPGAHVRPTPDTVRIVGEDDDFWTECDDRYDLHWKTGGPLIERYGIGVALTQKAFDIEPRLPGDTWIARTWQQQEFAVGPTPLIAACDLILKLHSTGKLREAK